VREHLGSGIGGDEDGALVEAAAKVRVGARLEEDVYYV